MKACMRAMYTAAKARPSLLPSNALDPLRSALSCTGRAFTRLASSLCWNSAQGLNRASYACDGKKFCSASGCFSQIAALSTPAPCALLQSHEQRVAPDRVENECEH